MKLSLSLGLAFLCAAAGGQSQLSDPSQASVIQKPSSLLEPALDSVAHAGSAVDLNRWKGSNTLREEVDGNLASIQKDLQTTLPPLLNAADAAPESASACLPVLLNLDALYSVLLRVTIASRSGAPRDQNTGLEQAATLLDTARRELGDTILKIAKAQEKRAAALQALILQQQVNAAAAAQPSAPPVKVTKRPGNTRPASR